MRLKNVSLSPLLIGPSREYEGMISRALQSGCVHTGKGLLGFGAASPECESALGFEARSSVRQAAFCLEAIYSAEACEARTV